MYSISRKRYLIQLLYNDRPIIHATGASSPDTKPEVLTDTPNEKKKRTPKLFQLYQTI
jgi:hypothetical protein